MDSARAGPSKDEEDDDIVDEPPKKVFKTLTGGTAILDLKNELLKKKSDIASAAPKAPSDKKGVLYVRKEEKSRLKTEQEERQARISEHEQALRREEARIATEQIELSNRKLKEKAELYEQLQKSGVSMDEDIGEGLIDFNAKKREADRERENERERRRRAQEEEEQIEPEVIRHVANEEPRMYGASHVIFSKDEEKRQKEMGELFKMTAQTDKNRVKTKTLAQKREEAQRAKANKLRKTLGLDPLPEPVEEQPEVPVDPSILSIPLPDPPKADKPKPKEREWDRGKGSTTNWVRSQREVRDEDFAPPSYNY